MKTEDQRNLTFIITNFVVSILTIIFATLAFVYEGSILFRILTEGCLCLVLILIGVKNFVYRKQKLLAILFWFASAFLLIVMIFTIYVTFSAKP